MKRFITIFVSSLAGIALCGQLSAQGLPVAVLGDVYIADNGQVTSVGTVHLRALPEEAKGAKVDNYGTLQADSVIFYSNDLSDGLLRNGNVVKNSRGASDPSGVAMRKSFIKNNYWYMLSLPFDVDIANGIVNPITGGKLVRGTHFQLQYYDSKQRADIGQNVDANWKVLPTSETVMKKGVPYRVAVKLDQVTTSRNDEGGVFVDFFAKDNSNIAGLFAKAVKGVDLTFYTSGKFQDTNSDGWNPFGGLNSSSFSISSATTPYPETVYYRTDPTGDWLAMNPSLSDVGTLRPFGVLFVQTDKDMSSSSLLFNGTSGGFTFANNGVVLYPVTESKAFFRSSETRPYDAIKLQLTSTNDETFTSHIFFKLGDSYSKSFRSSEDDIVLQTQSTTNTLLWSLAPYENIPDKNNVLFVNSLPLGESETVLGVNILTAGEYVFSAENVFSDNGAVESAILWDKVTNKKFDLLICDYPFQSDGAFNTEDRFVLFLNNRSITSLDKIGTLDVYAYAEDNVLYVKNLNSGDRVQVLDLTGRTIASGIASGSTYSVPLSQKGVYVVNIKGGKTLKVLNK